MRIDFYLLQDESEDSRNLFICRLLEKAYLKGHKIFVFCDTQKEAYQLDELLWTFKENSFIPHNLQGEGPEPPPPIQIGFQQEPRGYNDILINLSEKIPSFYQRFQRIIEIVSSEETAKELSRSHYRQYKHHNHEIIVHSILSEA